MKKNTFWIIIYLITIFLIVTYLYKRPNRQQKSIGIEDYQIPYQFLVVTNSFKVSNQLFKKGDFIYLYEVDTLGGTKCWGVCKLAASNMIFIDSSDFNKCKLLYEFKNLP